MPPSPQHVTLVASTVATVTFDEDFSHVEVINVDGVAAVYFRCDGTDPTTAGAGSDVVVAAVGAALQVPVATAGNTQVKLISVGTPKVSVRGVR